MTVKIQLRRGTAAEWTSNESVVLSAGEPGFETNTGKFKVGDGATAWSVLPYAGGAESLRLQDLLDVSSTSPSSGQVLKWNGTAWAPAADASGGGADGNTTYTISSETVTGGANLRLTGSDSTTDDIKFAAGANVTITSTDVNTITISSSGTGGGASNLDDLGDVVIAAAATGEALVWDGTIWANAQVAYNKISGTPTIPDAQIQSDWTQATSSALDFIKNKPSIPAAYSATSIDALSDVDTTTSAPTDGQALVWNTAGSKWLPGTVSGGGGTLSTRAALSGASGSLADGASETIDITGYKSYMLMKIQTSAAAWVRIYTSTAARLADAGRAEGTDPVPGAGVIAEVITTTSETILISPGAMGFNDEGPVTTNIPVRVTNKSGASATITVTLTALELEA